MLTHSLARGLEIAGYVFLVAAAFLGVFRRELAEKVVDRLHVIVGVASFVVVDWVVADQNDKHLFTFPCFQLAQQSGFCTPHPAYVAKPVPSWSETQLHTLPKEFAVLIVSAVVAKGIRRLIRKPAAG